MSTAIAWVLMITPVVMLVGVVIALYVVGKAAAGERIRWPWKR
jgi:ABC-type dipeptide/oligopeptide/nickel transport system permease subunit